jgi:anti-sigma factor RsiW
MTAETNPDDREQALLLVHALVDGELDPANASAVERRMASDPVLAGERARIVALRRVLQGRLPRDIPPPGMEARIRRAVGLDRSRSQPSWRALAASVALAVVVSSAATWMITQPFGHSDITDAVLAGHVRALMAPQTTDVLSSDRHAVKPWFAGRIPQAPRVIDLNQEGFRLVGGRIDVVGRAGVPTLVYQIREHVISLTAVPGAAHRPTLSSRRAQGYNIITWTEDNTTYWAVSDVSFGDLEKFARLFRDAPS